VHTLLELGAPGVRGTQRHRRASTCAQDVALSAFPFLITSKEQLHYCTLPVCACFCLRSVAPYSKTPARRDLDPWHSFSGGHTNFKSNLQPCALRLDFIKLLSSLATSTAASGRLAFVGLLTVLPSSRPGHLSSFNLPKLPLPSQTISRQGSRTFSSFLDSSGHSPRRSGITGYLVLVRFVWDLCDAVQQCRSSSSAFSRPKST
jgi:hypothetical protein